MRQLDHLHRKVKDILLADWDPIGIRDVPQAADEYDGYVTSVVEKIIAGSSVAELSEHLLEIERKAMGLSGDGDRAWSVAVKLRSSARAVSRNS